MRRFYPRAVETKAFCRTGKASDLSSLPKPSPPHPPNNRISSVSAGPAFSGLPRSFFCPMWHLFCFIQEQELGSGLGAQYRISLTCSAYSPSLLRKGQPSGAGLTNFGRGGKGKMFSRGHRLLLGLIIVMAVLLWGFVFHGSDAPRQAQITGPFTPGKTSTGLADTPKKVIKKRSPMPCSVPRETPKISKETWKLIDDLADPCSGG